MLSITMTPKFSFQFLLVVTFFATVLSLRSSVNRITYRQTETSLNGFMDMMNKALANDPSLPPAVNPGLSNMPDPVEVQFLPSGKKVKAYLGQNIGMIAKAASVEIKYSCKKGECGTCMVNFNGQMVKACQSNLPVASSIKKFQIGVPSKLTK